MGDGAKGSRPSKVAVIGAGIVGSCAAIELRRRGLDVTLVDRVAPGESCSFGNAGILAATAVVPFALPGVLREVPRMLLDPEGPLVVRWGNLSRTLPWVWRFVRSADAREVPARADAMKALYGTTHELHEALAREAGVPELVQPSSYLYLYKSAAAANIAGSLGWKLRRERGYKIEEFHGPAVREIEPEVSDVYQYAVRLGPLGKTTNPFRLTQSYARLFERMGGTIRRAEVRSIRPGAAPVVVTTEGEIAADQIVVAAGSWSLKLLEPLGFTMPLIAERGYHMTFEAPGVTLNHVVSEPGRHVALSTMEMGMRIAGTEELGDPDAPATWRRAEILGRIAKSVLPRADLSRGTRWMGPRPGTPDSLPAIGPLPGHPNIIIAAGHGHLGLTGAPETGRIVGALVSGERINMDLAPYAPGRFAGRAAA